MWDMGVMVGHGEDRMLPNLEAEAVLIAKDGCQGTGVPGMGSQCLGVFRVRDEGPISLWPPGICDHGMDPRDGGAWGMGVLRES